VTRVPPAVEAAVEQVDAAAYVIPTDAPEADGTLAWDSTTLVLARVRAGGREGIGYTYGPAALVGVVSRLLAGAVRGRDAMAVEGCWGAMVRAVRNAGRPGLASMAIAAVDSALWDVKARLLDLPLAVLLGRVRDRVPVYGSGGFTSYDERRLRDQLGGWVAQGIPRVKMKVGRDAAADRARVRASREAIGPEAALFVDANGAYGRKEALAQAEPFAAQGVTWFEEPVPSDDLDGLRMLRDRVPPGMEVAAGEYGYDSFYFLRMLQAGAVDVLMPDASRCGGITGFLKAGTLCEAFGVPLSAHTAPALHLHACCALPAVRHLEWFHDHVRIEAMLFDGAVQPVDGTLAPDTSRPGLGIEFRAADAVPYAVEQSP
jgi:L-alanine-DL-glutamate epimerase-like enolase superfamily enzyme